MSDPAFPEIHLVDAIRHGSHPQGRFVDIARPVRIEFSKSGCQGFDEPLLRFIVYHEIGHWFRWAHLSLNDVFGTKPEENFFIFASPNSEEGFADAFASYYLDRAEMQRRYPEQLQKLARWLKGRDTAIVTFGEFVMRKLCTGLGRPSPGPRPKQKPVRLVKPKSDGRKKFTFAGHNFTAGDGPTVIERKPIDFSVKGDHGADPIGDGTFRMVPSGDIVDFEERNRRLSRFHK